MTKVVRIDVRALVNGTMLQAQGATLTLGVNAIPSIELQCAPSDDGAVPPLFPEVKKNTISDYGKLYGKLSIAAESLSESCIVFINLEDNTGKRDSLMLNGWILTGVGMSSVSAVAAPHLSVILQHPICKLTKLGSIYETARTEIDKKFNEKLINATDFLQVITETYKFFRDEVEYWPAPNKYPPMFRTKLGVGDCDPNKYLVFKTQGKEQGIFLWDGKDTKVRQRLAQGMARYVFPDATGSSTWDMLVKSAGNLLLSVTQDEDNNYTKEKLVLEPTHPWKSATITLNEEDCFWTDIQGMNPFRLIGVMARKLGPFTDGITLGLLRNGNALQKEPVSEAMYSPLDTLDESDGRIMKTSAPAVLDAAFRRDAPYGETISTGMISLAKFRIQGYDDAVIKYCKAVYEIASASMIQAKAQMALWFTDAAGKLILPGNTCKFISNNNEIYYGYIRNVVHHMSTEGGCATTLALSYVRSEADFKNRKGILVKSGSDNAAYEKGGV